MPDSTYVPIKDRPVNDEEIEDTTGICLPVLCGATRKRFEYFYPGPTIMMHKLHWQELLFGIYIILSVGLTGAVFIGQAELFWLCGMQSMVSLSAVNSVWGIAKVTSLAKQADKLEEAAMENHEQICAVEAINDEWEEGLKASRDNLDEFTNGLGIIGDDASKIDDVQKALSKLVEQKKLIQKEEKAIFMVSLKHQRVARAEIEEKQRGIMKSSLLRNYDRLDRKGDGSGVLDDAEEIAALKAIMTKDSFLNKRDQVSGHLLYKWESLFDEMASDGKIEKYELLDGLDIATESYYYENRDGIQQKEKLMAVLRAKADKKA